MHNGVNLSNCVDMAEESGGGGDGKSPTTARSDGPRPGILKHAGSPRRSGGIKIITISGGVDEEEEEKDKLTELEKR